MGCINAITAAGLLSHRLHCSYEVRNGQSLSSGGKLHSSLGVSSALHVNVIRPALTFVRDNSPCSLRQERHDRGALPGRRGEQNWLRTRRRGE